MTRRYKAFISYSWADKDWGGWLHRTLELYRTPAALIGRETAIGPVPAGLHPIFKDREEEAAGHGVGAAIEAALAASDFLIVICSPRSATSQWVNREVAWFKTHKDKTRILALIVDGEPGAAARGNIAAECFPGTLTHKVGADLQPTEEKEDPPLAADARKEGDGKRGAKLKLAAALLGVGLDDLVKRDERRRAVRRRLAMSGMAAGMAIFAGIALYAVSQRDAAVVARNDAVKARDDAEGLIELILTDLKQDLEGYGTLKSVTQIGNRAIGYYEGQDVKSLTPDQLGRRARVLLMLGEADNKRGDLDAALARYKTAEATTSEQLARDPDNAQRIFDHAQSVFWVGYIAWQRGERAKAKEQFTEYHRLATRLVEIDPEKDEWRMEVGYAVNNLGILAMEDGDAEEARDAFYRYIKIADQRVKSRSNDVMRLIEAGQARAWAADALVRQFRFEDALSMRSDEISHYQTAAKIEPENAAIIQRLATANQSLAAILLSKGDLAGAQEKAAQAAHLAIKVQSIEPEDTLHLDRAASALAALAEIEILMGNNAAAGPRLVRAATIGANTRNRDVASWDGIALAKVYLAQAAFDAASANRGAALRKYNEVERILRPLITNGKSDQSTIERYCAALSGRAKLSSSYFADWTKVIDLLAQAREKDFGPEGLRLLAQAYLRQGMVSEAEDITRRLYNGGFRHPDFVALLDEFPELKAATERRVH